MRAQEAECRQDSSGQTSKFLKQPFIEAIMRRFAIHNKYAVSWQDSKLISQLLNDNFLK